MKKLFVIHVHGSSPAALTDFFTSSGPLAILSILSDKRRIRYPWEISTDEAGQAPAIQKCRFAERRRVSRHQSMSLASGG
jgi:hypothetical protein